MSAHDDLNTQIAQRLFGWHWQADAGLWRDPDGVYCDAVTFRRRLKAYTTDAAATALVWQWLEERDGPLCQIRFLYGDNLESDCVVSHGGSEVVGWGATWQDALCRAALALAEQGES